MKIKINPLMIPMIAVIYFSRNTKLYILTYLVMAIHEAAHLVAAFCIGLKPQSITFSPFGVNLKLKNKIISSIADEVILYISGPLINGIFAIAGLVLEDYTLYRLNTALMIINLLPVIPLDGGMICIRLLSYRIGQRSARKILNTITLCLSFSFLSFAFFCLYKGYINISMFIISALMIGNVLTSGEMCDIDFINILSGQKKKTNKVRCVLFDKDDMCQEMAKCFSPSVNTVVFLKDTDGKIIKVLSEEEIMREMGIYKN